MTKNEIINEIKSVVMKNDGEVKHGQIRFFINENGDVMVDHCTGRGKNAIYESKAQLEIDIDVVKFFVEDYYNTEAKTVEAKAENTENTVEVEKNDNNVKNMTKNEMISEIKKLQKVYGFTCFADMDKWGEAHLKDVLKGVRKSHLLFEC